MALLRDNVAFSLIKPRIWGSVNGGFQTVVRVWSGEQIPPPHFNHNLTLIYLCLTSSSPLFCLNLTYALPAISNHGLETTAYRPLENGYFRVFRNLGFAKPRFCNPVLFAKTTGITKTAKTAQTATNKGVGRWIRRNHGNHGNNENHANPGCKT